ncbi:hypothetical protein C8F04DRAFT_1182334 [Mycena alexandri]|uniref:Uncharacterized protein n=1 Tax=Mycena alexandri TaxID=1745969 RepID=A0AAD6T131_9AGAR|nr:hypothetical protein C8F04DRAFT_1182334 [Mycena alexandri]
MARQPCKEETKQKAKAAKRREKNRRYYARKAKKIYRRQWDPPKQRQALLDDETPSITPVSEDEAVAHAVLSTMPKENTTPITAKGNGESTTRKEPKGLAEIAAYESSRDDSSSHSTADTLPGRRQFVYMTLANARAGIDEITRRRREAIQSRIEAERSERMRIVVESRRTYEEVLAIHQDRGSIEVEKWLQGVQASNMS